MNSKTILGGLVAMAVLELGGVAHADPMVANTGFNSLFYNASSQFGANSSGPGVTGWTGTGSELYLVDGTQTTVSAANYDNAPNTHRRPNATTERLAVNFGSDAQATAAVSVPSGSFNGRMQRAFRLTASSASEVLTLQSLGAPSGLPPIALLDGVSVMQTVPEPVAWATLVLVMGIMGGTLRTLRRQT